MALIQNIISKQSFEIIRDRIAIILRSEILNQFLISGDYEIDASVFLERVVKINTSELDSSPIVVVGLATGDYSNQDVTQSTGIYQYLIDVYTKAKTNAQYSGDSRSRIHCQRMLGICRAILEASQYITLGYNYPFVMGRKINSIQIAEPEDTGADSVTRGRLILEVKVPEYQQEVTASLIDGSDTTMFVDVDGNGLYFVNDDY